MKEKVLKEVLALQANGLNAGEEDLRTYLTMVPGQQRDLESLMTLAARVKKALLPVEPSPAFVQGLRRSLMAMARRKQPGGSLSVRRGLLIGAATLGSALSVAGIIAYVVYARANSGARTPFHG
jgi:hypothetical protein